MRFATLDDEQPQTRAMRINVSEGSIRVWLDENGNVHLDFFSKGEEEPHYSAEIEASPE